MPGPQERLRDWREIERLAIVGESRWGEADKAFKLDSGEMPE